uniref:AlNc14C524G12044 protein n=1 Tax=Albugo laibachii Nc14 TaxID=890382 RepID=F0X0V4_9STRA|nr:AlNc14C524G12044 [Albugo laibachii Nc14]|eukprot:CCA27399.1 AlNc14C524G12044 [Albugo laibachii Nc14]
MKTCIMNVKRELPTPMVYPNLNLSPGKNAVQNENCAKTGYLILDSVGSFLEYRDHQCLHIAVTLSTSQKCIYCVTTTIKSPVLLASLSYLELTLLTKAFGIEKIRQACNVPRLCGTIALEKLRFCSRYRTSNAINPRFYPELVKVKRPTFSSPTCLLAHNAIFRQATFWKECIKRHIFTESTIYEYRTSSRTWLHWIRKLGGTASQQVDLTIWDCQSGKYCLKVD